MSQPHTTVQLQPRFNVVFLQDQQTGYRQRPAYVLGCIQVVIGMMCVVCQATVNVLGSRESTGIWTGIFFVVTGITCMWAGRRSTGCSIISVIAMSMVSIMFSIILLNTTTAGISGHRIINHQAVGALRIVLAILALSEGIAAFASTWVGCVPICHIGRRTSGIVIAPPPTASVTVVNNMAVLPPCQMPVNAPYPAQQVAGQAYIAAPPPGFQPQYATQPPLMTSPPPVAMPPAYTAPSEPPPAYSTAVPSAVPSAPPPDRFAKC